MGGSSAIAALGMAAAAMSTAAAVVQATPVDRKGKGRAAALPLSLSMSPDPRGVSASGLRKRATVAAVPGPGGVPAHYEYKDGEWVHSEDWSLNGKQGEKLAGSSQRESQQQSDGSGVTENTAHKHSDDEDDTLERDNDTPPTSLGWARTSQNVLGVDINTELADPTSTATAVPTATTATTTGLATMRTNMATLTSSSSSSVPAASSTSSTVGSGSNSDRHSNGQTYDFRRDVPDGWLSDGRTAAYAVPVIVGLSIFLSCLIFSLLVIFVRATTSRRARRKQAAKLQEEGRLKKLELPDEDGNLPPSSRGGPPGDFDNAEKQHGLAVAKKKSRFIGRRWTPSQNGALRRRRKDIAKLFNRHHPDDIGTLEVIDPPTSESTNAETTSLHEQQLDNSSMSEEGRANLQSSQRDGQATRASLPIRRLITNGSSVAAEVNSISEVETGASAAAGAQQSTGSRPSSPTPSTATTTSNSRRSPRPPSIRIDAPTLVFGSVTSAAGTSDPVDTSSPRSARVDNGSSSTMEADTYAVPLPAIGPPAYIHPPSPAYSRSVALLPGDSYLTHLSSRHATSSIGAGGNAYLPSSAASTPGLPTNMDEKRLLLAHQAQAEALPAGSTSSSSAGALQNSDPYREQRRYEHLYASREGEAAGSEQRTGAPSSSSSRGVEVDDMERQQHERVAGHIAVDDKEVLARIREARSAPGGSSVSTAGLANAPSFDEQDDEDEGFHQAVSASQEPHTQVNARASGLPLPPRAINFSSPSSFGQMDEKARMRMMEEQQASAFSNGVDDIPSAPPAASTTMAGSAPPMVPSAPPAAVPSAPIFEDEDMPEASAPAFVIDDEEVVNDGTEQQEEVNQDNRPYREGTV